ncbi:hypothetical protein [Acanthopleuribacter pedis]|uniref:Uncharacterized protein n=1 Tax=Acanthopleuribacter pedis TaxID=442870 RepID=A0A8J7U5E0_9BACT|nr:hypothetical protein [Acanthopleuribacter pedis]MBO1321632.1 hypothetical protein [Acanthopleuribacter pedis]
MDQNELVDRFPEMKSISSVPPLFTFNGIGLDVVGRRDLDMETGTYVKTHCLVFLLLPLFSFGAYRVADDPNSNGWFFIGKVPLSPLAKGWNLLIAALLVGSFGTFLWRDYHDDPRRQADRAIAALETRVAEEQWLDAVRACRDIHGSFGFVEGVNEQLKEILGPVLSETFPGLPPAEQLVLFKNLVDTRLLLDKEIFAREGLALAHRLREAQPDQAFLVIRALRTADAENQILAEMEQAVLLEWNRRDPANPEAAEMLAFQARDAGDPGRVRAYLEPAKDQLGTREGAWVLAQILLENGESQAAFPLLNDYVTPRLPEISAAATAFERQWQNFTERQLQLLQNGHGPEDFYRKLEPLDEAGQQLLVQNYINKGAEREPTLKAARQRLEKANELVPAALELGLLHMDQARARVGDARTESLQAAEKTFLAIGGIMGDNQQYRLFLGQVKYWLGREKEGRALFEAVVAGKARDDLTLLNVAAAAREVGDVTWARSLCEEAYESATLKANGYSAAYLRSVLATDLEDKIHWLDLADPENQQVRISRDETRASLAMRAGDKVRARKFLQKALKGYGEPGADVTVLNNAALIWRQLFGISGDIEELRKAAALMEQAIVLNPSDAILLTNTAEAMRELGVAQLLEAELDLRVFSESLELDQLDYLITETYGPAELRKDLAANDYLTKAVTYWERSVLLAPKNQKPYDELDSYYFYMNDVAGLTRLRQALGTVKLDETGREQFLAMSMSGTYPEHILKGRAAAAQEMNEAMADSKTRGSLTSVMAACSLSSIQRARALMGEDVDDAQVLTLSADAYRKHPSLATLRARINSHYFVAHRRLIKTVPEYAALFAETKNTLSEGRLLNTLLAADHPLAARIHADPDVRKAAELEWDYLSRWPERAGLMGWAVHHKQDPVKAARFKEVLQANAMRDVHEDVVSHMWGGFPDTVLRRVAWCHFKGESAQAKILVADARKAALPIPEL